LRPSSLLHKVSPYKEAGRQLGIGEKSVETYKARGMEKLALKTRAELVRYAAGQGLVRLRARQEK